MTTEHLEVKITADTGGFKQDISSAKEATKAFGNESKTASGKIESLSATIQLQQGKLEVLKAKYERLTQSKKASAASIKEVEARMKLLNTQITINQQKLLAAIAAMEASTAAQKTMSKVNADIGANGNKAAISMEELGTQLASIRSLSMADVFLHLSAALASSKDRLGVAISGFKLFGEEFSGIFNFKNFDVSSMSELFASMKIQGQEALKSLGSAFLNLGKVINQVADSAAFKLAKVLAAVVAIVGAVKMGISSAQRLSTAFNEAQKIGMSVAAYQEWEYILGKVGVEADRLSDWMKTLAGAQNEVRDGTEDMTKAFNQLGLTSEEVMGMTQESLFTETVKRLQQVENQVDRTSLAYRIFGEDDAADLNNILNLNSQEMERLINNYYILGGGASDSAIQKSRIFTGAVSNMKLAWQGLSNTLGEAILPMLTTVVNAITKAIVAVNLFIRTVFGFDLIAKGTKNTIEGTSVNLGSYTNSVKGATTAVEKLKRTTQGFDELNIVSDPAISGSAGSDSGGGGGYEIPSVSIPQIDMESLNKDLGLEEMTKWFDENAESIRNWTIAIGAATAAWKIFKAGFFLTTGKHLTKEILGWLGAFIGLVLEGNSVWSVFAVAFPKVAAALAPVGAAFTKIGAAIAGAAKAVGAFIAGLSGTTLAVIAAIIAAVASAVYFLVQNWEAMGQVVKDFFAQEIAPKLEKIGELFGYMGQALYSIWDALAGLGVAIWEAFPEPVQEFIVGFGLTIRDIAVAIWDVIAAIGEWIVSVDWLYWIGEVIEWLGGIVVAILGGVIGGAIDGLMSAVQGIVTFITGIVQIISGLVGGLINLIVALFTGDLQKAFDSVMLICMGILNLFVGLYDATIGVVIEFVEGIIAWFVEMWDELVGHSIVPDMIEAIIEWFFKLPGELIGMMADFVQDIIAWFASLAQQAGEWAGTMWEYIKKPFLSVGSWFKNKFTEAWNGIKNIFRSVGSWFRNNVVTPITGVFSDIGSKIGKAVEGTFSKAVNVVLSTAVSIINGFISAINAAISLINEIPGVSIDKLDKLEVPELATGGIVMGDTLARIGEGGKREAVLPLDQNTGWMDMLADRIANRSSAPTKVVLMVNERELGWASIDGINGITKQTGGIQLQLV